MELKGAERDWEDEVAVGLEGGPTAAVSFEVGVELLAVAFGRLHPGALDLLIRVPTRHARSS